MLNKASSINAGLEIVLVIFSLFAVVPAASSQEAQAAQKTPALDTAVAHIENARRAYASNKLNLAKDEAKRALKFENSSPDAHLILALVYRAQNKQGDAIKSVKEAIKYRQDYADAHYVLAVMLYERNDPREEDIKQSGQEVDRALSQGLDHTNGYILKGRLAIAAGDFEQALEDYKKARQATTANDPQLPGLQEQLAALESYVELKSRKDDPAYKHPVPLGYPRPNYTEDARSNGVQGVVKTKILVNEQGEVKLIMLLTHLGHGLDEEAIKAVKKLKFSPATKDGNPVLFWVEVQVEFKLEAKFNLK